MDIGIVHPSRDRVSRFMEIARLFLSMEVPVALLWLRIFGMLSSLDKLVTGGQIRIGAFNMIQGFG